MSCKIVVIDGDLGVLDMVGDYFRFCGFEVHTVAEAADGIEACRKVLPDIVLLDLKMRQMSGGKALGLLREAVPDARIFIVTSHRDDAGDLGYQGYQIDALFEKPVEISELQSAIQEALADIPRSVRSSRKPARQAKEGIKSD